MIPSGLDIFGWVCGQDAEHTWASGGVLLPLCQRCTGLYIGALVAALLHWALRPRLSGRFLEVHGLFLLLMVPFGFHWVSQGPWLRSLSGSFFGFGVATFLWLGLTSHRAPCDRRTPWATWLYAAVGLGTAVLLPVLATHGGLWTARSLSVLAGLGLVVLVFLAVADIVASVRRLACWLQVRRTGMQAS